MFLNQKRIDILYFASKLRGDNKDMIDLSIFYNIVLTEHLHE